MPSPHAADVVEALLKQGTGVRMMARGSSMEPVLPGGSLVDLIPILRPPRCGEVVLARTPDGRLVLHRVLGREEGNRVRLKGDSSGGTERVREEDIVGRAELPRPSWRTRLGHWAAPVIAELSTPTRAGLEAVAASRYATEAGFLRPEEGLEPWEASFSTLLPPGARVLDLGCGSGREARALETLGFRMTGADPAAAPGRGFVRASAFDFLDPALLPGPFDAILLTRGLYSLLPLKRDRTALLSALGRRLSPGGILALHALEVTPRCGPRRALVGILRTVLQGLLPRRFRWERGDRMLRYLIESGVAGAWVFAHVFPPGELEAEGRAAGYGEARRLDAGGMVLSRFSSQTAAEALLGKENSQTGTPRTRPPS